MVKVFLVDDEIVIREGIRNSFPWEESGYTLVGEAPDGEIALPMIRDANPDILITDIRMPQRIRGVKGDKVGEGTRSVLADHEVAHTCRHRERNAHHHNQHGSSHRARSLLITHSLHRSSFLLRPPSQPTVIGLSP